MNLVTLLEEQVKSQGDHVAIYHGELRITFNELSRQSQMGASFLQHLGLKKGDRALVFVPMSIDLYVILIALWRCGVAAVFLDPASSSGKIKECCSRISPACFIGIPKAHILRITSGAIRRIPLSICTGPPLLCKSWGARKRFPGNHEIAGVEPEDPALITFTSGSTGKSKGTVRTHGFLVEQNRVLQRTLSLQPGTTDLSTLPIFALVNLASGVSTFIPSVSLSKPAKVLSGTILKEAESIKPQTSVGSPAFFLRLLKHENSQELRTLKTIYTGGAPVFPRYLEEFSRKLPQTQLIAVYGSTEAEPIAELNHEDISRKDMEKMKGGSGLLAGKPIDEIECKIVADRWGEPLGTMSQEQFDDLAMVNCEPGEIVVSGSHVLEGYLDGVGDHENKFTAGSTRWHRTGDLGYLDERGRLWLLGRCGAKISDDRGELYPFAVETAVMHHEDVVRVALLGIRQKRVLVVESHMSQEKLEVILLDIMRKFQIDQLVLQPIPMDKRHNAKVDYPALLKSLNLGE